MYALVWMRVLENVLREICKVMILVDVEKAMDVGALLAGVNHAGPRTLVLGQVEGAGG